MIHDHKVGNVADGNSASVPKSKGASGVGGSKAESVAHRASHMEEDVAAVEVNLGDIVIVDCSGMDYICSSGLRIFLGLYKDLAQKGGKLIIRNLQPLVKGVFDMSGFSQIFNIE